MDAEDRVRAALAAHEAPLADDVAEVLAELERWRAIAAERWTAIGALAPRAKELRLRSQDLERAIAAARDRLADVDADLDARARGDRVAAARDVLERALDPARRPGGDGVG